MTDFKSTLIKLNENLNVLRIREAKYGGNAPLDLLNQISDHQTAITLTEQAIAGDLSEAKWREAMRPLLIAMNARGGEANVSSVTIGDIHGSIIGSEIAGRDISIGQKIVNIFTGSPDQQHALRNRQIMLEKVRQFWVEGVLENSLYNAILIELGMEEKPEAVEYPWERVLQRPHQSNRQLPSDTEIIDAFDQAGQSLLILGEPGSGKTTMLLELARHTLARAQADFTQPMPVVFNLSSWGEKRLLLIEWLIEEFNTKYNIPRKVALSWLENDELLLLLDGLDEVAQDHQVACIEAINTFRQEHLIPLVVCSRAADYEALSIKLILQQAILLKPLTKEQINNYLAKVNPKLIFFQNAIQFDSDLREFVKSPLMLSIMLLVQEGFLLQDLNPSNVLNKGRKNLLDIYVKEMFRRRGTTLPYSQEQSTQWLAWITRGLNQYNQTIFLIEQLQPSWLLQRIWRWVYVVGSRLTSLLILGLLMGAIFAVSGSRLYLLKDADVTGPIGWVTFGTLLGLAGGLIWGILEALRLEGIGKNSSPSSWTLGRNILVIGLSLGLLVWLSFWFISNLSSGLTFGIAWGLILGISLGVRSTHQTISNDIQIVEAVSWSWTKALKTLPSGLAGGLLLGLMMGLITQLDERLSPLVETRFALEFFGKPNFTIISTLYFGLIGGLLSGFFGGLSSKILEGKTVPNQGIWLSVRNAVYFSLNLGLGCGIISGLWSYVFFGTINFGLLMGLSVGVITAFWYGGLDIIQHLVLRLILCYKGYIPWRLVPFLDHCVDRIFLRRVGGGYIFIHRYLMEYFALLTPEDIERLSSEMESKKVQPA